MTLKRIARRIAVQLHIALALLLVSKTAAIDASKRRAEELDRELNGNKNWFNLRLFWKEGYNWQMSHNERKWCMRCRSGNCSRGSGIRIARCNRDDSRQHWFFDDGRIRSRKNKKACLERDGRSIHLRTCNQSVSQIWDTLRKDEPFQLRIPGVASKCASQHHHPKEGERLYMTSCKRSMFSQTDKWMKY
ncbi:hypothetical protein ACHAXT_000968 [Thalassiosira profunda]